MVLNGETSRYKDDWICVNLFDFFEWESKRSCDDDRHLFNGTQVGGEAEQLPKQVEAAQLILAFVGKPGHGDETGVIHSAEKIDISLSKIC